MPNSLALCVITSKGDEAKARALGESLKSYVNEVVITVCDKGGEYEWNDDFASARNYNFSKAKSDWILWLDADDTLRNPENLRALIDQAQDLNVAGYWVMYEYAFDENGNCVDKHWKEQLVKNDGHCTWKGKIHETLVQLRPSRWSMTSAITRVHNTTEERAKHSFERNLRILEKEIEADPKEPRTKFYLGRTYQAMGEYQKAIAILQEYLTLSGWDDERHEACMLIGHCYVQLGDYDTAILAYNDGILEKEGNPDAYLGKAHCYMGKERWNDALWNFKVALELPVPEAVTFFNPFKYNRNAYHGIAWCYLNMAKLTDALTAVDTALEFDKDSKDLLKLRRAIQLSKGKHDLARKYIDIAKFLEQTKKPVTPLLASVPPELSDHELIVALRNRCAPPKTWAPKTLAVFCGTSAEDWTPESQNTGGIGGSETAVIELTKRLAKLGWDITVYNQGNHPPEGRVFDGVKYVNYWTFNVKDKFNVLWVWRLPELFDFNIDAKFKFLDLHDVMSPHDFPKDRLDKIDKIFVKTNYHRSLFPQIPDDKFVVVGNGISLERFETQVEKDPYRFCYTSSPNRGLDVLLKMWPKIKEKLPEATLHVYYGWNTFYELEKNNPERMAWMKKVQALMDQPGVIDHGRVGQKELAEDLLKTSFWLYPTNFPEIDCITAKEMQAAGVVPLTSGYAALEESQQSGLKKPGDVYDPVWQAEFTESVVQIASDQEHADSMRMVDASDFSWDLVASKWNQECE